MGVQEKTRYFAQSEPCSILLLGKSKGYDQFVAYSVVG